MQKFAEAELNRNLDSKHYYRIMEIKKAEVEQKSRRVLNTIVHGGKSFRLDLVLKETTCDRLEACVSPSYPSFITVLSSS